MSTIDFLMALFYQGDEQMHAMPKPPDARLWPSEGVTLGLLHTLKADSTQIFPRLGFRKHSCAFPDDTP